MISKDELYNKFLQLIEEFEKEPIYVEAAEEWICNIDLEERSAEIHLRITTDEEEFLTD